MTQENSSRPFITTERLRLRPLAEADVDGPYLEWFNDPEVCRFNSHHVYPYTRDQAVEYIRALSSSPDLVLAMCLAEDDRHIGNISLQGVRPIDRSADFAIVIGDKNAWGKGFGYEAGASLLRHGFDAMNLHRVEAGTSTENKGMRALAEKLGMSEVGTRRQGLFKEGRYHDLVIYDLLEDEYRAR